MPESAELRRWPIWAYPAACVAIFALAASAEFAMGRKLWGTSGTPGIWSGNINNSHNSQYMTDPYTFTHVTHGVLLYGLIWLVAGKLPVGMRAVLAIAAESSWEVIENTDMVIRRYRAATMSLHYCGDSVMNSMCDILACMVGFGLACVLPPRVTAAAVIVLEIALALWIRDGLFLNILMLIHPVHAISAWQLGK